MRKKRAVFHLDAPIARALGVNEAIVSYHLCFWIETNEREGKNFVEGRYWTYNSVRKFSDFIDFLSEKQIKHALNNLYDAGYLLKGHYSENKLDRSLWYSLSDKYYQEVFGESIVPTGQITPDPQAESIVPTGQMYISKIINTDNKNKDLKNTNARETALVFDAEKLFETFWSKYPRKVKRQVAFLAFEKALSNKPARGKKMPKGLVVTPELIMQGLEQWIAQWKREGKEKGSPYIPDASTWLNDMCYLDSLEASPTNGREAIAQFNQQNGLRGDSAVKGYYNLPRHLQEDIEGNWRDFMPKTEEERKANELAVKRALGLEDEE